MTYVQPHFRYGALSFIERKREKIQVNTKFKRFESKYNKTWKTAMKIPSKTAKDDISKILGIQNAQMLTFSSYLTAYNK